MAQLFTGHASPDSIDRLVVQSERKADKIRNEGIEQLKGMQDVYQHHVNESTQIINFTLKKRLIVGTFFIHHFLYRFNLHLRCRIIL